MQDVEMLCSMPTFSSLKSLDLQGKVNDKLLSFTSFQNLHSLEISWSENLTILQFHGELHALKNLDIGDCPELTTVLGLQELMSLEKLEMRALAKLQFSPGDWLPSTLHSLKVVSCIDLSRLPLHHHLSALKEMLITNRPQLGDLEGLQNLSSIENLQISACEKLFLPLDEALPSTLKSFKLDGCHNLKSIPVFHDKLSELNELVIENCERLTSVAGLHNLTSLETLEIRNCRDLQLSPNEALPSTTLEVKIVDCPGLIDWCESHGVKHSETEDFEIAELDEYNSVGEEEQAEEEDEEKKWHEQGTDIENE
ncbi:hypothetical protein J5N97_014301 [Dioscorea zingiberensis]|uniref:Disease resistance protein n=1 Tax=Dioscorea zingiberensis TaxID=325984 RepID=A0A9D5HJX8_9LILI|nr:hypothetical protein J5N97_014301 [Dioscorea zingiberensis]